MILKNQIPPDSPLAPTLTFQYNTTNHFEGIQMLVLSRERDQTIQIDGPCTITVVRIRDNKVRIGIDADKSVSIVRGELLPPPPKHPKP